MSLKVSQTRQYRLQRLDFLLFFVSGKIAPFVDFKDRNADITGACVRQKSTT
jgi:hypothetical protein